MPNSTYQQEFEVKVTREGSKLTARLIHEALAKSYLGDFEVAELLTVDQGPVPWSPENWPIPDKNV